MNSQNHRLQAIQIPSSDFDSLRFILEQLTMDEVTVQNAIEGRNLRTVEIQSVENRVNIEMRSDPLMYEDVVYQSLTIAVIAVVPERMGIGTKVIEWLKSYAINKGFERLCIENAHTDASIAFALKHGFTNVPLNPNLQQLFRIAESPDYHIMLVDK